MKPRSTITLLFLLTLIQSIRAQTTWPHYLLLEITFDAYPSQTSWAFLNARSMTTLASRDFGFYSAYGEGETIKERLEILTEVDLEGDPLDLGVVREYQFVIYDEVCCFINVWFIGRERCVLC
jgi:hypothetical protein